MTKLIRVFESGSGKWVYSTGDSEIGYTSNKESATIFTIGLLIAANNYFADFRVYRKTLHVVEEGANQMPYECPTVIDYINNTDY